MTDQPNPSGDEGREDLQQDAIVDRIMPDPSQLEGLTTLSGFLSRTQQQGRWRLYLTPSFDEYVELEEEDIVYGRALPESASALGGTWLWVRSSASLRYTRITSREIQAEFLMGTITASMRGPSVGHSAMMNRAGYLALPTHNKDCASDDCESDVGIYCPTKWSCGFTNPCGVGTGLECLTGDQCVTDQCDQSIVRCVG
jgi:hypothetical protein